MTVLFIGGEAECYDKHVDHLETDSATRFDADFARMAIWHSSIRYSEAKFPATTSGWFHCTLNMQGTGGSNSDAIFIQLIDSTTGQAVVILDADNGVYNLQYWDGATFPEVGANIPIVSNQTHTVDIEWRIDDVNGRVAVWLDEVLIAAFNGDMLHSGFTTIDQVRLSSQAASFNSTPYYSEVIIADESTLGWRLATLAPTGAGNSSSWAGAFDDVDAALIDDTTAITTGAAGQVEQFAVNDLPDPLDPTLEVKAVGIGIRSRHDDSGPQSIQASVRTGGSDFFGANITHDDHGFHGSLTLWQINPDTAETWTKDEVNALEIGLRSQA